MTIKCDINEFANLFLGRSRFIVKLENGEPSERYWLGMFTEWLQGMQNRLDQAQRDGILFDFDTNNATKTSELNIAYSLACSYGHNYDCSRVGIFIILYLGVEQMVF